MDRGMEFELTARFFFGDKAYGIASAEMTPRARGEWLGRIGRLFMRRVAELDTTVRHGQILMAMAEQFEKAARSARADPWELVYRLFGLVGCLLGYDWGKRLHTPAYWQTIGQGRWSVIEQKGDLTKYDQDAITIKRRVAETLRKEGLDDFKISLVLNTTEYEVKKLRRAAD